MPDTVNFDMENVADGDKAQEHARSIRVEFDPSDVRFWFQQLEGEMLMASVKSQWLKKTILQRNLPNKQKEDVKSYLTLERADAGNHIYFDMKSELIRIYAQKPQDTYAKALTRTMTGLPSQLGYQIINDICKKPKKLDGCCCAAATLAIWSLQLPVSIRAHISDKEFTKETHKAVFEAADKVFMSARQVNVAAAAVAAVAAAPPGLDETQSAFEAQNQPQVAAVGKPPKKNKKNKNKNQNGQSDRGQ